MKRLTEDSIKEIAAKKTRTPQPDMAASWRMSSLIQTFNEPHAHRQETLRYFPVAVIAVIEGYFRSRLAELIDAGEPFITNALKSYPEIKLDISMAGAITTNKVTIGGLISHSITLSNFPSLVKAVIDVSGHPNFLKELAQIRPDSFDKEKRPLVIADPADAWARLASDFEIRHILCHELASDLILEDLDVRNLLLCAQQFIRASSIWIAGLQNPNPEKARREIVKRIEADRLAAGRSFEKTVARAKSVASRLPQPHVINGLIDEAEKSLHSLLIN